MEDLTLNQMSVEEANPEEAILNLKEIIDYIRKKREKGI